MKYLLVLLVVGIGLWSLVSRFRAARRAAEQVPAKPAPAAPASPAVPVVMLQCAHCGLHLPESDTLADGALRFCSEAHRRLGPRPLPPE